MSYKNDTISVLAVSTTQDEAVALLNKCFKGLQTSDNQVFQTKVDNFNVVCYTKYPGTETTRKSPDFADLVVASVEPNSKDEKDIVSYVSSRFDAKYRILISDNTDREVEKNVLVSSSIDDQFKTYVNELTEFNKVNQEEDSYNEERYKFNLDNINDNKFYKVVNEANKKLKKFQTMIDNFSGFNLEEGLSQNTVDVKFHPENLDSKGVGILLDLIAGEEFIKQNPVLPLTVRDNAVTISIEIKPKSIDLIPTIKSTLEEVKEFISSMGLLEKLLEYGLTLSISSDEKSAYIDLTVGGVFGESLINKFKAFNLDQYKLSINDDLRIQTNLNLKDLYENPQGKKIISDVSTLSIIGSGRILNIRSFLHLIREAVKIIKKEDKKKGAIMISYGLLALSTFEKVNCEVSYNHESLLESIMEIAEEFLGSTEMIDNLGMMIQGFLPMLEEILSNFAPMLSQFEDGIKAIDFDKISVEILSPSIRASIKTTIVLPGLTDFVGAKVFN